MQAQGRCKGCGAALFWGQCYECDLDVSAWDMLESEEAQAVEIQRREQAAKERPHQGARTSGKPAGPLR